MHLLLLVGARSKTEEKRWIKKRASGLHALYMCIHIHIYAPLDMCICIYRHIHAHINTNIVFLFIEAPHDRGCDLRAHESCRKHMTEQKFKLDGVTE